MYLSNEIGREGDREGRGVRVWAGGRGTGGRVGECGTQKGEGGRDHSSTMPKAAPYMRRAAARAKLKEHHDDRLISARAGGGSIIQVPSFQFCLTCPTWKIECYTAR